MENTIKMDDLGVPLFSETPICFNLSADFNHQAYLPEGKRVHILGKKKHHQKEMP